MEKQKRFSSLPREERQLISLKVVKAVSSYLQLFIPPVIARRIISAILIIAGVRNPRITELTLDNARYQKCEAVTTLAHDLKIDLVYLPPFSANLNCWND